MTRFPRFFRKLLTIIFQLIFVVRSVDFRKDGNYFQLKLFSWKIYYAGRREKDYKWDCWFKNRFKIISSPIRVRWRILVPIWRRRGTTRRLINRLPFENRFSDGEKTTRRLLDRNEFDRFNRDRVIYPWKERRVCSSWRDVTLIESATAGEIGGVTAAHGEQERWLPIFRTTRRKNILKDLQRTLSLSPGEETGGKVDFYPVPRPK